MRVLGYVRVSKDQSGRAITLDAQRAAIAAECERRGWELVEIVEDSGRSGTNLERPGIRQALEQLAAGEAGGLMIAKVDRLARSMQDLCSIMATAQEQGWALVALDCGVDLSTAAGEAMAQVMGVFGALEARLISERTRTALAAKRAAGVELGGPNIDAKTAKRIRNLATRGHSLGEIARRLNDDKAGAPTARGGVWHPATVRNVLQRGAEAA